MDSCIFHRLLVVLVIGVALGLSGNAPAQQPVPATTRAALDLSNPQAAAKSIFRAVEANDAMSLRVILYAATPQEKELAGAMADFVVAAKNMADAARARFGADADKMTQRMISPSELNRLDGAKVEINEDNAVLRPKGEGRKMHFRKDGEGWKLVINDFATGAPQQVATLKAVKLALDQARAEIAAGKYATAQDAEAAIQQKLYAVIIDLYGEEPATRP